MHKNSFVIFYAIIVVIHRKITKSVGKNFKVNALTTAILLFMQCNI